MSYDRAPAPNEAVPTPPSVGDGARDPRTDGGDGELARSSPTTAPLRSRPAGRRNRRRLGVALSGGGFRAAAFHLGVLKRLEELGVLNDLGALSVVSGGAIAGAMYAIGCVRYGNGRAGSYPVERLIEALRPILQSNLRGRAISGTPWRALRTLTSFVFARVRRGSLLVEEFDHTFFHGLTMKDVPPWLLINATNLSTGAPWRFCSTFAGDYVVGRASSHTVRVAEAVGASAAFPGLTDAYEYSTSWEALSVSMKKSRFWLAPTAEEQSQALRWRQRFGKVRGRARFLLVDGGVYDNEGVCALRAAGVTDAILSCSIQAGDCFHPGFTSFAELSRVVEVMHSRLGGATREIVVESTHGVDPTQVREDLLGLASALRQSGATSDDVLSVADQLENLAHVGTPHRGHQFRSSAQIVLSSTELVEYTAVGCVAPSGLGESERGLERPLVEEIARVRTDLDALEPDVFNLLVSQGYALADARMRVCMPDLLPDAEREQPALAVGGPSLAWPFAVKQIRDANDKQEHARQILSAASRRRMLFGRSSTTLEALRIRLCALSAIVAVPSIAAACWLLARWIT
jgi:predicted acylesterase/phospholipase RssA